jgi:hypothetical protein
MLGRNPRLVILATLGLVMAQAGRAKADLIYTQAGVSGDSSDGSGIADPSHYQTYLTTFVSGGEVSSAQGTAFETRSVASVGLVGSDAGIHLFSSSLTSNFPKDVYPVGPGSEALAAGQWEDVIRLGGDSRPDSVLIHVSVSGNIQFSAPPAHTQYRQDVRVGVTNTVGALPPGTTPTNAANLDTPISEALIIHADPTEGGNHSVTNNTNGFFYSATSGNIGWGATFVVSYDPSYGGYHFNLYASDYTRAIAFTDVTADFSHTLQLTAVTQTDGSTLSGPITFASGYQLNPVPEPASLVGASSGAFMILFYAYRRRSVGRRTTSGRRPRTAV